MNNINEMEYLAALRHVREYGIESGDRTGTGTRRLSGIHMDFDTQAGFPLMTTKKVNFDNILHELLWFISGDTNIKYLTDNGVNIWSEWADEKGNLGPVYGKQWRSWMTDVVKEEPMGAGTHRFRESVDQLQVAIDGIKDDPDSRRLIVNSWNVGQLPRMALPPCHLMYQFICIGDELSIAVTQRSADMFLGVPYNIASYTLLLAMVAGVTNKAPRYVHFTLGDAHVYENHIEQVDLQLSRETREPPSVWFNNLVEDKDSPMGCRPVENIDEWTFDMINVLDYNPHPFIAAPIAV
jgi:thymidylate synthase